MPVVVLFALVSGGAIADDRDIGEAAHDARLEGQLWMSYALNRHLNPFDFEVDVSEGTATVSGKVEESVQRDLAEQIALSINGIDRVDDQIEVVRDSALRVLLIHCEPTGAQVVEGRAAHHPSATPNPV